MLLEMNGPDAANFAHRMFSRNISRLPLNHGVLSLFLSADGKIASIFWAVKCEESIKLIVEAGAADALCRLIGHYHFAEKFELKQGPQIAAFWRPIKEPSQGSGELSEAVFAGRWRNTEFLFDIGHQPSSFMSQAQPTNDDFLKEHRIQNLIPQYGEDYDESTLVFEAGLEDLCDDNKGCYIGQEIVERVRSRGGKSAKHLAAVEWTAPVSTEIEIKDGEGSVIGKVTRSVVKHGDRCLTLAYLKRGVEAGAVVRAGDIPGTVRA